MGIPELKDFIRKIARLLHADWSKNLKYDRLTEVVLKKVLSGGGTAIDAGSHKGEILDLIIRYSGQQGHYAFEPIPVLYTNLQRKFGGDNFIFPYALGDRHAVTTFQYVKNAPAYSGIKQREYDVARPDIEEINVEVHRLDDVIPSDVQVKLIKIDVEGGEWHVISGGRALIARCRPLILFEFGLGASDRYQISPDDMFFMLEKLQYRIFTLDNWIKKAGCLDKETFSQLYFGRKEYYFLAESK